MRDFFDPQNGLTTSSVLLDGAIVADPQQNPRLMENPDLQAYLPAILDRSEFRIYACGDEVLYDIVKRSAPDSGGLFAHRSRGRWTAVVADYDRV